MNPFREAEIARLEQKIEAIRSLIEPVLMCVMCHDEAPDEDEFLTDATVVVADGEEGYSNVTLLLCSDHLDLVAEGLGKLGFIDHRHGATSTLEDRNCPGFSHLDQCPTPTHYGNVTWGRRPPQDSEEE